ncbi:MAG: DUF4190 domain-containing protein [Planctomycetota bacterium]
MTEPEKGGFQPAPWEQKPQPKPQQPQQGYAQPQQSGYPQQPGYPQQRQAPQQQAPIPGAYGGPIPNSSQGPYGHMPPPMPGGHRPGQTSTAAIVAVIGFATAFVITGPVGALVGIIAGFIALGDIKKTGKNGRGMALTGLVGGAVYMLLFAALIGFIVWGVGRAQEESQMYAVASQDAALIENRIGIYYRANNNSLAAGGKQVKAGYPGGDIVRGSLKVSDLVNSTDLNNPVDSYQLTTQGESVTITLIKDDGREIQVGKYHSPGSYEYYDNYNYR